MWTYKGQKRPDFARAPGPGQESVWDYPRPPALVADKRLVRVELGGNRIAATENAIRVLETASPPTFYLDPADVDERLLLQASSGGTFCEWKGRAQYWDLEVAGQFVERAAWSYPEPTAAFEAIAGWFSFYPGKVACHVGDERVRPQQGGFYGGWVTAEIVGPYKGEPGTAGW